MGISIETLALARKIRGESAGIPPATATSLGLVKGTNKENGVSVNKDGSMEINEVNFNKIVQTKGDTVILYSGNSEIKE